MLNLKGDANFNMPLEVSGMTDKGMVRRRNEDYHGYFMPTDQETCALRGSLFAVSDGVGGNVAGNVASAEAVNVLLQEYYFGDHAEKCPQRLRDAFSYAAMHIYELGVSHRSFSNMQCTLTALLLKYDHYYIAHAGDSKAFLLRDGSLTQLTKDHSVVAKLVRMGFVSAAEAKNHPQKHALIRALGERPILPVDSYTGYCLPGDIFCLVTDGISEHLTDDELRMGLLKNNSLDGILKELITTVNERGGTDNMTILAVKVLEVK